MKKLSVFARTSVVHGDYEGKADVIDRLTVELTWDISKSKFLGPVAVKDGKSELRRLTSDGTNAILGMPGLAKVGPISVSADGKSFSIKGAENWTWTYTPTILQ